MMRNDEFDQLLAMFHQGQEPLRFDDGGGAFDGVGMSGFDGVGNVGDGNEGGNFDFASLDSLSDAIGTGGRSGASFGEATTVEGLFPNAEIAPLSFTELMDIDIGSGKMTNAEIAAQIANSIASRGGASVPGAASKADLALLSDLGFGKLEGLNPQNETQSVNELAASNLAQSTLIPLAISFMPGSSLVSAGKLAQGVVSGQISLGQAITQGGVALAAKELGLPAASVSNALEGRYGAAVASVIGGKVAGAIAQVADMPGAVVGAGLSLTGAGKAINDQIASAVNSVIASSPTNAVSQIASSIDSVLGTFSGAGSPGSGGAGAADGMGGDVGSANTSVAADTTSKASTSGAASLLPMIAALGAAGLESDEDKDQYRNAAQITAVSPFGSMPYSG